MQVHPSLGRPRRRHLSVAVIALGVLALLVGPVSAATPPPVPTITAKGPAQTTTVSAARITAKLTAVAAGETIYLDRLSGHSSVVQTTARLSTTHTATFSVTQAKPGRYAYQVRVVATRSHRAAKSAWVVVEVVLPTPDIKLAIPAHLAAGTTAPIGVTVTKAPAGDEIVLLEQRSGSNWKAVGSGTTSASGSATIPVAPARSGSYLYRARLAPTTRHKAGTSPTYTVPVEAATRTAAATAKATATAPSPCGGISPRRPDGTPWVCSYDDEFDQTSLDRRYWVPQVSASSGFYTGTSSSPACVIDDPRTIAVSGGQLRLSAQVLSTAMSCGSAKTREVSGMVTQYGTFSQTYGKYEIRAKLPSWTGKGLQETFWLWPNDVLKYGSKYPASGEIDLAEFYSNLPGRDVPAIHYLFDPSTVNPQTGTNVFTAQACRITVGAFNTYGLEWAPGTLTVLVNDRVCLVDHYTATNAPATHPYAPFDSPFFLTLTQAFGAAGNEFDLKSGPRTSTTLVDYVRVWS